MRRVAPGSFFPMPKVRSAVVRLDLRETPAVGPDSVEAFLSFLRAGFTQPRKQLHNSLAQGLSLPPSIVQAQLRENGFDPSLRPGQLSSADWVRSERGWSGRKQSGDLRISRSRATRTRRDST